MVLEQVEQVAQVEHLPYLFILCVTKIFLLVQTFVYIMFMFFLTTYLKLAWERSLKNDVIGIHCFTQLLTFRFSLFPKLIFWVMIHNDSYLQY